MTRTRHVFRQDVPCLRYAALGDTAVRALAIHHIVTTYDLDAIIVPQFNPTLIPLWQAVFGCDRVIVDPRRMPERFKDAQVSSPTDLDWQYGAAAWNVFESVMWENGFFDTRSMRVTPPVVFPCDHDAGAVMIYPNEGTDGNRVFDSTYWIEVCRSVRKQGYAVHMLGDKSHPSLRKLYAQVTFDHEFPPTLAGLRACVAVSSTAIGGSTGPTWTLLFSDIPQIVLEAKRSPHGYWFFDRCQQVLTKRLAILPTIDCVLSGIARPI